VRAAVVIDGAVHPEGAPVVLAPNTNNRFTLKVPTASWLAVESGTGTVAMRVTFGRRRLQLWRGGRGPSLERRSVTVGPGERAFS
jgi:hypothetical protein